MKYPYPLVIGLCDSMANFAMLCENVLRQNAYKGHWGNCTVGYLLRRFGQESKELREAIRKNRPRDEVLREAADVANFCMMIAENYRPKVGSK